MNLTSEHPHAVYIAGLLAEREDGLLYGNLEDEFLCFVEKDNAQTREVLSYLGYLLFFYKNRDESGRCVLDLSNHRDAIFGDSGLVAAFRIYCMLENFTRKGWIQSEVAEYPVLETLDRPQNRIELTLTPRGIQAGNSIIWRYRLMQGGIN